MVKLIASDLDGTLRQNGAHDVNPIVFDQIRTLKEHGIMIAAASRRQNLNLPVRQWHGPNCQTAPNPLSRGTSSVPPRKAVKISQPPLSDCCRDRRT